MAKLARSIIDRDLLLQEVADAFPNMEAIKAREFKPSGTRSWEEMLRNYANIQTNKEVELKDSAMVGNAVKYLAKYKGYNPDPQLFNAKGNLTLPEGTENFNKESRRALGLDYKGAVEIINRVANTITPDGSGALMYPGLNRSIAARNKDVVFNPARDQILQVQNDSQPWLNIDDILGWEPRVKAITNSAASRPIHEKARNGLGDSRNIMTQAQQEMYAKRRGEVFTEPPEKQSFTNNFVRLYNTGDPLVDVHKVVGGQPVPLFDEAKYRSIGEEFGEYSANKYRSNVLADIAQDGNQIEDRSWMLANPDDVIRRASTQLPPQTIGRDRVIARPFADFNKESEYVAAMLGKDAGDLTVVPRSYVEPQALGGYRRSAIPTSIHGNLELLTKREQDRIGLGRKTLLADSNNDYTAGAESLDSAMSIANEVLKNRDARQLQESMLGHFVLNAKNNVIQNKLSDLLDEQIVDERRLAKMGIPDARMFRDSIPATNAEYGIESDTIRKPVWSNKDWVKELADDDVI